MLLTIKPSANTMEEVKHSGKFSEIISQNLDKGFSFKPSLVSLTLASVLSLSPALVFAQTYEHVVNGVVQYTTISQGGGRINFYLPNPRILMELCLGKEAI